MTKQGQEFWRNHAASPLIRRRPTLSLVLGVCLLVQSILVGGMLMLSSSSIAPRYFTLAVIWLLVSSLLGIFIVLRSIYTQKTGDAKDFGEFLLGFPDNELSLPTLANVCNEGIAVTQNQNILYVNASLAYLLGATQNDLLGTPISRHIHPDDQHLIINPSFVEETVTPMRNTLRLVTELGDYRWVVCSIQQLTWQDEIVRLLQFSDISLLKDTQLALEETEQHTRIFIERAPLGVATFDAMGQLCLANTAWYSVWRSYSSEQGRRFNVIQDQFGQHSALNQSVTKAYAKEESVVEMVEESTAWGETRWLNVHFYPVLDPVNTLTGVIMIQQDMTESVLARAKAENLAATVRKLEEELEALRKTSAPSNS